MTDFQQIEEKGNRAVRKLRKKKLSQGHPFMINSRELASNQAYLEFPSGSICLVCLEQKAKDFTIIRELSQVESGSLRQRYRLSEDA
jgi:hypothetical protein